MSKDVSIYLEDILESIDHILTYTKEATLEHFKDNDYMQDAVIRRFQIIGEATKRIPDEFKQKHSHIPWRLAAGIRDVLIHEYDDINPERLWQTIKEDLPPFKKQIQELLKHQS